MPCGKKNYYAMCYSFGLSLTIIINDVDQYFKKKIKSKKFHSATCQILMDEWELIMSASHMVVVVMELHSNWKWIILIELQLSWPIL